jgi:type IV secretory pathway protease TraF
MLIRERCASSPRCSRHPLRHFDRRRALFGLHCRDWRDNDFLAVSHEDEHDDRAILCTFVLTALGLVLPEEAIVQDHAGLRRYSAADSTTNSSRPYRVTTTGGPTKAGVFGPGCLADLRMMSRRLIPLLAGGAVAALALAAFTAPRDLMLYNPSPSVPEGLYVRTDTPASVGPFVTVRARDVAPQEARRRNFTDASDRFIKRVAAVGGDRVCGDGRSVVIGESVTVVSVLGAAYDAGGDDDHAQRSHDRDERLVGWRGCRILNDDEVLLLGDTPDSFDGRYWGPVSVNPIEGVWRRL